MDLKRSSASTNPPAQREYQWDQTNIPISSRLYADGRETFFPMLPCAGVYDITLTGLVECSLKQCTGLFPAEGYRVEADAISHVFKKSMFLGNGNYKPISWSGGPNKWLLINDHPL